MADKPVFIAGIGPRTGTTLIQRIVNTHPEAWIWGEVGGFGLAEGMWAAAWNSTNKFRDDFHDRDAELYERLENGDRLVNDWVGGLVPSYDVMREAYKAFFTSALRTNRIWGFKAISCSHLNLMRNIFPEAKSTTFGNNLVDVFLNRAESISVFFNFPGSFSSFS